MVASVSADAGEKGIELGLLALEVLHVDAVQEAKHARDAKAGINASRPGKNCRNVIFSSGTSMTRINNTCEHCAIKTQSGRLSGLRLVLNRCLIGPCERHIGLASSTSLEAKIHGLTATGSATPCVATIRGRNGAGAKGPGSKQPQSAAARHRGPTMRAALGRPGSGWLVAGRPGRRDTSAASKRYRQGVNPGTPNKPLKTTS